MCVHMLDTVKVDVLELVGNTNHLNRWKYVQKEAKFKYFRYPELLFSNIRIENVVGSIRTWGNPVDKDIRGLLRFLERMATRWNTHRQRFLLSHMRGCKTNTFWFSLRKKSNSPRMSTESRIELNLLRHPYSYERLAEFRSKRIPPYPELSKGHMFYRSCILANNPAMELGGRSWKYDQKTHDCHRR